MSTAPIAVNYAQETLKAIKQQNHFTWNIKTATHARRNTERNNLPPKHDSTLINNELPPYLTHIAEPTHKDTDTER